MNELRTSYYERHSYFRFLRIKLVQKKWSANELIQERDVYHRVIDELQRLPVCGDRRNR